MKSVLRSLLIVALCALTVSLSGVKAKATTTVELLDQYYAALAAMTGMTVDQAREAAIAAATNDTQAALNQYYAALAAMSQTKKEVVETTNIIFVGDSRMIGMHNSNGETGVTYVAENSKGFVWFRDEGIPQIDPLVQKGTKIVINLGVNDPGNINRYITLVNQKIAEWTAKGATVYYCTLYPVYENPYVTQAAVDNFNDRISKELIGANIIDTAAYLKTIEYGMIDGLHYNIPTYKKLYTYIIGRISE